MDDQSPIRRRLTAADFSPKSRVPISSDPAVVRFASKLAERIGEVLSGIGDGPWRLTLEHIEENASDVWEQAGYWFRAESHLGSMRMHTALDFAALSAICEAALGGTASEQLHEFQDRPLSGIERGILRHIVTRLEAVTVDVLGELLETPVRQFDGEESGGGQTKLPRLTFRYLVNLSGYSGEIRLTAIQSELLAQLASLTTDLHDKHGGDSQTGIFQHRVLAANVCFDVCLREEVMQLTDILGLAPGSLLRLASATTTPVTLQCEGRPVLTAALQRSGGRLSVRIVESVA